MKLKPLPEADLIHIFDQTSWLWDELRGARLFVTGGTGFFGLWLLESFGWVNRVHNIGASMLVLTRDPAAFRDKAPHLAANPAIEFLAGDVRTFTFPDGQFSHIIHAATEASAQLNTETPLLMLDTIVEGTRHTLEFARHCEAKKFLLTSSGAVYGKQPPEMTHISEEYSGAPDTLAAGSAYGEGKRLAELLCKAYADNYGFEAKIARCFAFVGPGLPLDIHFAIGNFIRDGLQGQTVRVGGDGTPYRSYMYAADLAAWLWTILLRGENCRAYNVGSAADLTIAELAETVAQAFTPKNLRVEIAKALTPGQSAQRYVPSVQRAGRELDLRIMIDLPEAIRRTIAWYS